MIRLSPWALAGAVVATSLSVLAAAPVQAASRHVPYNDLDLTLSADRAVMDQRIRKAAHWVCRADNPSLSMFVSCSRASIDQAHADLDQALGAKRVQMASR
jgi:UrcA family protein